MAGETDLLINLVEMKAYLADKLDDFRKVLLLLQNLMHFSAQSDKLREVLLVVLVQGAYVLGVGNEPVNTGEVLALRQLLVQAPEDLAVEEKQVRRPNLKTSVNSQLSLSSVHVRRIFVQAAFNLMSRGGMRESEAPQKKKPQPLQVLN